LTRTAKPKRRRTNPPESTRREKSPAAAHLGGSLRSAARGQPVDAAAAARAQGGYSRGARVAQAKACPKGAQAARKRSTVVNWWRVCMNEWATLALRRARHTGTARRHWRAHGPPYLHRQYRKHSTPRRLA
jgi:hypothetical protein